VAVLFCRQEKLQRICQRKNPLSASDCRTGASSLSARIPWACSLRSPLSRISWTSEVSSPRRSYQTQMTRYLILQSSMVQLRVGENPKLKRVLVYAIFFRGEDAALFQLPEECSTCGCKPLADPNSPQQLFALSAFSTTSTKPEGLCLSCHMNKYVNLPDEQFGSFGNQARS
jgi:hypothetical protein